MDEQQYMKLADEAFRRIIDAFENVDIDDADVESAGDVITILLSDGKRCVVNTQRPARQIWLAGGTRAWHFGYDESTERWISDKDPAAELFGTLADLVREGSGIVLRF